jgi:hypothetical protein
MDKSRKTVERTLFRGIIGTVYKRVSCCGRSNLISRSMGEVFFCCKG